jgi:hypothetical protein
MFVARQHPCSPRHFRMVLTCWRWWVDARDGRPVQVPGGSCPAPESLASRCRRPARRGDSVLPFARHCRACLSMVKDRTGDRAPIEIEDDCIDDVDRRLNPLGRHYRHLAMTRARSGWCSTSGAAVLGVSNLAIGNRTPSVPRCRSALCRTISDEAYDVDHSPHAALTVANGSAWSHSWNLFGTFRETACALGGVSNKKWQIFQ